MNWNDVKGGLLIVIFAALGGAFIWRGTVSLLASPNRRPHTALDSYKIVVQFASGFAGMFVALFLLSALVMNAAASRH